MSWRSPKKSSVAISSPKAEYMALSEAAKEAIWLKTFASKLGELSDDDSILVFEYNQESIISAKTLSSTSVLSISTYATTSCAKSLKTVT